MEGMITITNCEYSALLAAQQMLEDSIEASKHTALIDRRDLSRLNEIERTWEDLFHIMNTRGDGVFQRPLTGKACAVLELNRLYNLETFCKARDAGIVR